MDKFMCTYEASVPKLVTLEERSKAPSDPRPHPTPDITAAHASFRDFSTSWNRQFGA